MLLVDTSVWIDHLRSGDRVLIDALEGNRVLSHPHVIGEIAMGRLEDRATVLALLRRLPAAVVATDDEVQTMIERQGLHGRGIGYIDAHLLAALLLSEGAQLWTRDRRLQTVAMDLGLPAVPAATWH